MIYYKKPTLIKILRRKLDEFANKIPSFNLCKFFMGIITLIFLTGALLYGLYLFFIPRFVDEIKAENILNSYLSKNTKLILDIDNLSLKPSYNFRIKISANSIKLKYSKEKDFIALDNPEIEINLPALFFGYLDLDKVKAKKITLNTTFTKSNRYDCFDYFDFDIFELKSNKYKLKLRNIRIISDEAKINLYDEKIKQNFYIQSSNIKLISSGAEKPFKIVTEGKIYTKSHKISDFDLNILFKVNSKTISKFKNQIKNFNINPFRYALEYKFYAKSDIDLKILPKNKKQNIEGVINLNNYTFEINGLRLPKNNVSLNFKGDKIQTQCDFKFIKDRFLKVILNADISKNKYVELKINSNEINLSELNEIINAFSKIINLKADLSDIKLEGYLNADLSVKSNFKQITSKGVLKIKDAKLHHKKLNLLIDKINSDISFADNKININSTSAYINDAKFYTKGTIDDKTNLDITIYSEPINIAKIIKLIKETPYINSFLPELNDYIFEEGMLTINSSIKGNLKTPLIAINSLLQNLKIKIKSCNSIFSSKNISINSRPNTSLYDMAIVLKENYILYDKYRLTLPEIKLNTKKDIIEINKSSFKIDAIKGYLEGTIKNYTSKTPEINIFVESDIPKNNKLFVIKNKKPKLNLAFNIKNNKIFINDCFLSDNSEKFLTASGMFDKNNIYNIKITILDKISILLPSYDNLSFDVKGYTVLSGKTASPDISSNLNLYEINCEKFGLYIKDLLLNIKNSSAYINIVQGKILNNDFDLTAYTTYKNKNIEIEELNFNSPFIDFNSFVSLKNKTQDIPSLYIKNLKGAISNAQIMDFTLNNINFEGSLKDNVLNLDKFDTQLFNGTAQGSINFDIKTDKTNVKAVLKNLNVRNLTSKIKEFSIASTGHLSALINASFTGFDYGDILKTFDGYVKFNIDDGELAQFARLERFLQAGNILSQSILKLSLNSALSAISKQNTGYFKTIEGTANIKNSIADIQYIKTQGANMSLYLKGNFNLISQNCNIDVYGSIPSSTVSVLGSIGKFKTQQLVDKMSKDKKDIIETLTASPIEKMLTTTVNKEKLQNIPPLLNQTQDTQTREFIVHIMGKIENISSIEYFKWVEK